MTKYSDEAIKHAIALVSEIENQSDRGAVIIGAAWVEEELLAAIDFYLMDVKKSKDRLLSRSGPLSSFSAKIDLACVIAIVSEEIALDLHAIREIRNDFAHSVLGKDDNALSFSSEHIKHKCLSLRCIKYEKHRDPRLAFIRACAVLNSDLYIYKLMEERISNKFTIQVHNEQSP